MMTPNDRRLLLGIPCPVCDRGLERGDPLGPCTCFDLDPFTDPSAEEEEAEEPLGREFVHFPLWDPYDNQSPFPDEVWAELADAHNAEQFVMHRLYRLLMSDLTE